MFRVMTEKEMLSVNGGFYNVPVYRRYWRVILYRHNGEIVDQEVELVSTIFLYERQVASDSGIKAFYNDHFFYTYVNV